MACVENKYILFNNNKKIINKGGKENTDISCNRVRDSMEIQNLFKYNVENNSILSPSFFEFGLESLHLDLISR